MDPRLVLLIVSTPRNKPVWFVNREIVRIIKESLVRWGGKCSKGRCEIGQNKSLKISCPDSSLWSNDSQYPSPRCSSRTPNIQGRYNDPTIKYASATSLALCSKLELQGMRGIACTVLVACLFSSKPKLGELPETMSGL